MHVPKLLNSILLFLLTLCLSCQKEIRDDSLFPPVPENPLIGSWKFTYMHAETESIQELFDLNTEVWKAVNKSDYSSRNNTGRIVITKDSMISSDISYDVSTELTVDSYAYGQFVETTVLPFEFSVPPSSSARSYKLVGTDSLHFPEGSFVQMDDGTGLMSAPGGCRFTLLGNELIMTGHVKDLREENDRGVIQRTQINATIISTLQRE